MIRYLRHHEIDKKKWDERIASSFNAIIYSYSWYLDIVAEGWDALVEDDYKAVMPLTWKKKFGIHYLYQPWFTQQLGIFSIDRLTERDAENFFAAIPSKFRLIEISLNTYNKLHPGEDITVKPSLTHELDLISSYESLHKQYSENTRRNTRKAPKHNLTLTDNIGVDAVIELFRNNKGQEVGKFREHHYEMLRRLMDACIARGKGRVTGVTNGRGDVCAGAFFIESNGKIIFIFSGRNEEAKASGAMFFLIDRFIEQNAGRNLTLDFEGSNDPDLARFYKGFGSKECLYLQVRKNTLPPLIRWLKKAK